MRQFGLNSICGINTRNAGTDNKNVKVGAGAHGVPSLSVVRRVRLDMNRVVVLGSSKI
jgi:hypothetical protein